MIASLARAAALRRVALLLTLGAFLAAPSEAQKLDPQALRTAREAARFVAGGARKAKGSALLFPEYAEAPEKTPSSLYAGGAGVLLFLENAAALLGDRKLRQLADQCAKGLVEAEREEGEGLYTGEAGVGFALLARAKLAEDPGALRAARRIADALLARMQGEEESARWSDSYDIISGAAGTLLFLLEFGEHSGEARYLEAARRAGRWLAEEGEAAGEGLRTWPPRKGGARHYPNFSHGTAGIAYALARVAEATGDTACLEAALAGAEWLLANAKEDAGGLCWFHYAPGAESSFREGWCHGPAGTGRLFLYLASWTGEERYLEAARRSGDWILAKWPDPGAEGSRTRFYSPSLCCGAAGVLDHFVDLYRATGEARYRDYARSVGACLLRLSKTERDARKWTNYDRPDEKGLVYHGLSLMLGASGAGLAFLRLAALEADVDPVLTLPDRRVRAGRKLAPPEGSAAPAADPPPRSRAPSGPRTRVEVPRSAHHGSAYVVLTSRSKPGDPWFEAAKELASWRKGELLADFDPQRPTDALPALARLGARSVALVLPPEEIDTNTQRRFLMTAARLDEDIFVDFAYGFVTGTRKTKPIELVRRARELEEKGLARRWIGASVASNLASTIYPDAGDPTAKRAGFEGRQVYWGTLESDPKVRDFVKRELPRIEGGGVVSFSGCGDPEGIWLFSDQRNAQREKHWKYDPKKVGEDPRGEMPRITAKELALLSIRGSLVWSGVCHTASLHRVFVEGDIVSTFGITEGHTEHRLPEGRSVASAILDAGAAAYIAPLGPNHGYRNLVEAQAALERGLSLGDILRSTYDDVALATGKAPELDLYLPDTPRVDRRRGAAMYGGGANRVLYGDPALAPFRAEVEPAVQLRVLPLSGGARGFSVEARVEHRDWWQWHMFATDENAERIRASIELPTSDAAAYEVEASALDPKGRPIPLGRLDAAIEHIDGKRLLHLQACAPRGLDLGSEGSLATFLVREEPR